MKLITQIAPVFMTLEALSWAADNSLKGRVLSPDNTTIVSVKMKLKNLYYSTLTGFQGEFEFKALSLKWNTGN